MQYTELFRQFREAQGLSVEELAKKARRHRNTVVNVESGRPVKFKTIQRLMVKMRYGRDSAEMKGIALLWLEEVSGISFSDPATEEAAGKAIAKYRGQARGAVRALAVSVSSAGLDAEEVGLLRFAAERPEVLAILENVRALAADFKQGTDDPQLKAAED